MRNEEMLHALGQTEIIKAVAHLRAAATIAYADESTKTYRNEIDAAIKAVEDLIE